MALEVERKFLLVNDSWRSAVERSRHFGQGYLAASETASARVRLSDDAAWLTIKGARAGISRLEFEYAIPPEEARQILDELCGGRVVEKRRHWVRYSGHTWEIDEFEGANAGLILAEIELEHPDEPFARPDWLGTEVSEDPRYFNAYLAQHPYQSWR